jgi:hypothetical protein
MMVSRVADIVWDLRHDALSYERKGGVEGEVEEGGE